MVSTPTVPIVGSSSRLVAFDSMVLPPTLISEEDVSARIDELAGQINTDYAHTDMLVLVGVLKGSFIFLADLARRLSVPHRIEFLAVSSYGAKESEHSDTVRLLMDLRHDIRDQDVLLVEDIVDTGQTLDYLLRMMDTHKPSSLAVCTLLHKPDRTVGQVDIRYLGFTIPDVWVVGFGLDYAEQWRTLPYIGELPPQMR